MRHRRVFALTGAGCSTASGIPDYRDEHGEWKRRPPVMIQAFRTQEAVYRRYWARAYAGWPRFTTAAPGAAHHAFAAWESAGTLLQLVTQNVDVTEFFSGDTPALSGLSTAQRRTYAVQRFETARSFVSDIRSFPTNIEVRHVQTFAATEAPGDRRGGSVSLEMRQSIVLLPKEPMRPRYFDPRVGYFTVDRVNYGLDQLKAATETFIAQCRLEPKDPEAYARGELVEPVKPIVYYIDPATPTKWRRYVKQASGHCARVRCRASRGQARDGAAARQPNLGRVDAAQFSPPPRLRRTRRSARREGGRLRRPGVSPVRWPAAVDRPGSSAPPRPANPDAPGTVARCAGVPPVARSAGAGLDGFPVGRRAGSVESVADRS